MCGRMTQQTPPSDVAKIFDAELRNDDLREEDGWTPSFNVAPTDPVTVVLEREDGRVVERHRWGLIPAWADSPTQGAKLINARAETVERSPSFRVALRRRRCIVPADGFYEWERKGNKRLPFYLHPAGRSILAFAGLWSIWKDPATGDWIPSCSVVTTQANDDVSPLHDRMPVVLAPGDWWTWLDPMSSDVGLLLSLLEPAPPGTLASYPVSTLVNSVRNNGAALIEPIGRSGEEAGRPPEETPIQETLFG
jgi:putative SOS response-associated peptidase YedK